MAEVTIFRSDDDEDRGGVVVRLCIKDQGSSMLPAAIATPEGIDLHIAGDAEAEAMIVALQMALVKLNAERAKRCGVELP